MSPTRHRPPRRLHAVRAARPLRSGHDRARRRPPARGRHRLRLWRPRHLRPLPGRGERGRAREARDHLRRDSPLADRRGGARVRGRQGPRAAPPARLHRPRRGRARDRRAAREPGAQAGRAQGGRRPPDRDQPRRPALLRRGRGARPRLADQRSRPPPRGARARVGAHRARRSTTTSSRACRRRLRTGRVEGHRRGARRHRPDRGLARLPRHVLRDRVRHRLDHGRRAPLRPRDRRGARLGRRDEPADPLRRGSDEPRLVRDDEPRLREGADPRRARLPREADGRAGEGCRRLARRHPRDHARRQPDHAPPPARPRPDGARRGAVRAHDRRGGAASGRATSASRRIPARAPTCCRASRAMSAPMRPA